MFHEIGFILLWIGMNVAGFTLGSYLGATSVGLLPGMLPGMAGIIIGDLVFGGVIGLFQWLVLKRFQGLNISAWWSGLISLGFTFGARSGSLLTYRVVNEWLTPSVAFGIFMGVSTGVAVVPLLWSRLSRGQIGLWVAASTLAWILGETIAFSTDFSQQTVPYVAVAISTVTGLGLLWLQRHLRSNP